MAMRWTTCQMPRSEPSGFSHDRLQQLGGLRSVSRAGSDGYEWVKTATQSGDLRVTSCIYWLWKFALQVWRA